MQRLKCVVMTISLVAASAFASENVKTKGSKMADTVKTTTSSKKSLPCGEYLCQRAVIGNSIFDDVGMDNCSFNNVGMESCNFENVLFRRAKIHNVCMTNLDVDYIQLAGSKFSNVIVPEDTTARFKGVSFEKSYLVDSKFVDCNLENTEFKSCNLKKATIDGILVSDLLESYKTASKK